MAEMRLWIAVWLRRVGVVVQAAISDMLRFGMAAFHAGFPAWDNSLDDTLAPNNRIRLLEFLFGRRSSVNEKTAVLTPFQLHRH